MTEEEILESLSASVVSLDRECAARSARAGAVKGIEADEIGADGYGENADLIGAVETVEVAKRLLTKAS